MKNLLLSGTVGSTAYGTATDNSDIDTLGVFIESYEDLTALSKPAETVVKSAPDPDAQYHEVGKFVNLLLKNNPTVTELLWLPEDMYQFHSPLGDRLIENRERFVSRGFISAAIGTARTQAKRAHAEYEQGDKRRAKLQKHAARYLYIAAHVLNTREVMVRLTEDIKYAIGIVANMTKEEFLSWVVEMEDALRNLEVEKPLPEPDREFADNLLRGIRADWNIQQSVV